MGEKSILLFDMDGVVLNSMCFHVKAWQEAFIEFGHAVDAEILYLYEGAIEPDTAVKLFGNNGVAISRDEFHGILNRQMEIFTKRYAELVQPYPDVPAILKNIKEKGHPLALVTSSHRDVLWNILPREILALFDCVVTGDAVKRRKPHPDPYETALRKLGTNGSGAIAVENAPSGIRSAKAAGARCIAIATTLDPKHLKEADLVVKDHGELLDVIET